MALTDHRGYPRLVPAARHSPMGHHRSSHCTEAGVPRIDFKKPSRATGGAVVRRDDGEAAGLAAPRAGKRSDESPKGT